jgi:tyrosyl-tRNA synthetase
VAGSIAADLRFRGIVNQTTDDGLLDRLDTDRLTLYAGFDPTAPSLHVGSLLQLCLLRRLQMAGHRPIALAGGATGAIGDPGGKSEERPLQTREEIDRNLAGIRAQMARFLDLDEGSGSGGGALLLDNRQWLGEMGLLDFLRDVGKHFTVNQMVAKESVRSRLERPDHGISYAEFSYMLLQAYDFLCLHDLHGCELQIGGSDQWGNITMGVELVRKTRRREVFGLTTPLVTKADGTKFGKTEQGTVWLDPERTSPYRFFQFFLQTEDAVVGAYLRYLTFLPREEIEALDEQVRERPQARAAQRRLAHEVTSLVHGEQEAIRAERASRALFDGSVADLEPDILEEVVRESPSTSLPRSLFGNRPPGERAGDSPGPRDGDAGDGIGLVDALIRAGLVSSKGEGRRKIAQGGIYVNDRREHDGDRVLGPDDLLHGRYVVLRRGKHDYHVLRAEAP